MHYSFLLSPIVQFEWTFIHYKFIPVSALNRNGSKGSPCHLKSLLQFICRHYSTQLYLLLSEKWILKMHPCQGNNSYHNSCLHFIFYAILNYMKLIRILTLKQFFSAYIYNLVQNLPLLTWHSIWPRVCCFSVQQLQFSCEDLTRIRH